ncbi:ABC transporter substrate-binding protein [Kribbella sp. VKM Ac-2568]|uniref:ABC transporter substrate-binding protein n=1 Tax=Kribbella sp. VKM Ac-2568 TaxID=2512219 RepID=UPI0010D9700D|nr:extracellular solute-binding protein [Kribbella sp. VKM Ac-2568]TCM36007.1 iron(III) transport system substrate-binding protein [Kribbella sp. VKM Ac-2568]
MIVAIALTATLVACSSTAPAGRADDAPETEGTLTWYTDDDAQEVDPVIQVFTKQTGIKVVLLATEFVAPRLVSEKASDVATADVISFAGAPNVLKLEAAGVLAQLPTSVADALPEQNPVFVGKSGSWFSNQASSWGVFYNTDLVDKEHAPTDFRSFLDPYWTGKFSIPISTNDSSIEGYYQIAQEPSLGEKFLTELGANEPVISGSSGQGVSDVIVGNQLGGISNDNAVWQQIAKGAPLAFVYPPKGTTFSQKYNGLVEDAAHPKAAEEFLKFLITKEAAALLSTGTGKLSTFPGIPAAPTGRPSIDDGVFFALPDPQDLVDAQVKMVPFLEEAFNE